MIIYPNKFHNARPANFDGIFNWDFLLPAFGGTLIMPMDIDAVVERHGKVLIFETKDPGKDIPLGQQITLETFLKLGNGNVHIMIIYGKTESTIEAIDEWRFREGLISKTGKQKFNSTYVLDRVTSWFKWANQIY